VMLPTTADSSLLSESQVFLRFNPFRANPSLAPSLATQVFGTDSSFRWE
jgi:hypothetical protein